MPKKTAREAALAALLGDCVSFYPNEIVDAILSALGVDPAAPVPLRADQPDADADLRAAEAIWNVNEQANGDGMAFADLTPDQQEWWRIAARAAFTAAMEPNR